jgi:inner membrane transporter RhtA
MSGLVPRPILLVLLSSTSIQLGTAIATTAFAEAGPLGAVWVRGLVGALLMTAWVRSDPRRFTRAQVEVVVPYAIALAAMVACIYLALDAAPLGVVSAILMLGPLTVSALGSRGPVDLACVGLAALGVLVLSLAQGTAGGISLAGIGFALGGAAAFGAYIHAGKRVGQQFEGFAGLAAALLISAGLLTPLGLLLHEDGITRPEVLLALGAAGLLATVIPFALELTALRSLSAPTFGLLLSFEPAIAAVAGFVVRGQRLEPLQLVGIGLIIVASAGSLGPRGWTRRLGAYNRALMTNPTVAALAKVPLFSGLSARDLGTIASVAEERQVPAGTVLTEQGGGGDEFFIVADGEVAIEVGGREIRRLGPGDYLGEIALVFGGKRTATATAEKASRLYVLGEAAFTALLRKQPRIEDKILTSVSERMRFR